MLLEHSYNSGESLLCIPCGINMQNDRPNRKRGSEKGTVNIIVRDLTFRAKVCTNTAASD
jgi:hypothetical protein